MESMSSVAIGGTIITAGVGIIVASATAAVRDGRSAVAMIGMVLGVTIVATGFALATESLLPLPSRVLIGIGLVCMSSGIVWAIRDRAMSNKAAPGPSASHESKESPTYSVNSTNQSGGITAGKVVIGPVVVPAKARHLDDNVRTDLLAKVPRGRSVLLMVPDGDAEASQFAFEIKTFLRKAGYEAGGPGMLRDGIVHPPGPTVHPGQKLVQIVVGSVPIP